MFRFDDSASAWDGRNIGNVGWRGPACDEPQWADLVSEVCECFERGSFADVTAAQAALDSGSFDEPLSEDEILLCLRSRWPVEAAAPVVFVSRAGRRLGTELLERRDALSATPGLQLAGFAVVASRLDILPFVSGATERPAYVSYECGHAARDARPVPRQVASSLHHPNRRICRARAAAYDVALAEFISAGELALTA